MRLSPLAAEWNRTFSNANGEQQEFGRPRRMAPRMMMKCIPNPYDEMRKSISNTIDLLMTPAECHVVTLKEPWVPDAEMFPGCNTQVDQAKVQFYLQHYLNLKRARALERGPQPHDARHAFRAVRPPARGYRSRPSLDLLALD